MIDQDGPVLIEVNCRPCGGNMPAKFLDKISGQHETDSILDSYLKPACFKQKALQRYRLLAHGALKMFIVPEDIIAKSTPMASCDKMGLFLHFSSGNSFIWISNPCCVGIFPLETLN